jgi:glycosyltransferase involved in cell wall biosynthesis
MAYGTNSTGLAALLISRVLRTRLVVEIPGVPQDAYLFDEANTRWFHRVKHAIADWTLGLVALRADHIKLVYPTQLASYPLLRAVPKSTFHNFVPVASVDAGGSDAGYVLFLGHPWYLKGVDVLIQAFRAIAERVPQYRLTIIGHFPDRSRLNELSHGCPQIEIKAAVKPSEALMVMSSCSVFVLPSRTEAWGRVLLEAMAAGKPIVASRAGGIPHYVRHGENGLLATPGSVEELSSRLLEVLQNPSLARRLGDRGRELAQSEYSETAYVERFALMLREIGLDTPNLEPTEADLRCGLQSASAPPP